MGAGTHPGELRVVREEREAYLIVVTDADSKLMIAIASINATAGRNAAVGVAPCGTTALVRLNHVPRAESRSVGWGTRIRT